MSAWKLRLLIVGCVVLGAGVWLTATLTPPEKGIAEDKLRPRWKVGDRWEIETVTQPMQARGGKVEEEATPVRWQFTVAKTEKLGRHECFRLDIQASGEPRTQP